MQPYIPSDLLHSPALVFPVFSLPPLLFVLALALSCWAVAEPPSQGTVRLLVPGVDAWVTGLYRVRGSVTRDAHPLVLRRPSPRRLCIGHCTAKDSSDGFCGIRVLDVFLELCELFGMKAECASVEGNVYIVLFSL